MKRTGIFSLCLAALMLLSACSGCTAKADGSESDALESSIKASAAEETSTEKTKKSRPEHTNISSQDDEEKTITVVTAEPKAEPTPEPTPYLTEFYNACADALENMLYNHVFPDGDNMNLLDDHIITDSEATFAIFDADCDGTVELYVTLSVGSPSWTGNVYSYDQESRKFVCELYHRPPTITFYDNGIVLAYDFRGNMRADFSPYSIYKYNSSSNIFEVIDHVEAWQREMIEVTDYQFPYDIDKDGDGYVYYIDSNSGDPVDGDEYEAWRNSYFGNAHIIEFDEQNLTQENINALRR